MLDAEIGRIKKNCNIQNINRKYNQQKMENTIYKKENIIIQGPIIIYYKQETINGIKKGERKIKEIIKCDRERK